MATKERHGAIADRAKRLTGMSGESIVRTSTEFETRRYRAIASRTFYKQSGGDRYIISEDRPTLAAIANAVVIGNPGGHPTGLYPALFRILYIAAVAIRLLAEAHSRSH